MGGSAGAEGEKKQQEVVEALYMGEKVSRSLWIIERRRAMDYTAIALSARLRWDQTPMPS